MCKGYISLHRQIEDNWLWFAEPFSKGQAWVDLLLLASHSGSTFFIRGNKIDLQTGEVGYSKEQLASRWKWSRKKVLNFLKMLEKEQQITQHKTPSIVIVRLVNYEKYQKKEQQITQQKNNRRTTEEQQKNINNNEEIMINNEDNENNNQRFEKFWEKYDYKKSRAVAEKSFSKALKSDSFENIMAGLDGYVKSRGKDSQYWKQPSTWLNQECWKDEYKKPQDDKLNNHTNFNKQNYDEGTEGFIVV